MLVVSGDYPRLELKKDKLYVNGVLGKRFYKKFSKFIENNPKVKTVVFEDVPGSINDDWNVKSCVLLHQKGMDTELLPNSVIASGGVDLFISGNKRTIAKGAQLGVHSWSDLRKEATDYARDAEEHKIFIDFFNKVEMDTAFYWYTLRAAKASDIHWMSEGEIEKYGLRK
jgi:beta-lactamase class D